MMFLPVGVAGCERALAGTRARCGGPGGAAWPSPVCCSGLCSKEIALVWLVISSVVSVRPRRRLTRRRKSWSLSAGAGGARALCPCCGICRPPPPAAAAPAGPAREMAADDPRAGRLRQSDALSGQAFHGTAGLRRARAGKPRRRPGVYLAGRRRRSDARGVRGRACVAGAGAVGPAVGGGWFLAGFLPISNLFSLNASVAEHWLYLPSIGFLLFLRGWRLDLPSRVPRRTFAMARRRRDPGDAVALGLRTGTALLRLAATK